MILRPIEPVVASFLKSQIGSGSVRSIKIGLQRLCELYRANHRLRASDRSEMEQLVIGVLYSHGPNDSKVRRWALNAVARIGRQATSSVAVTHALQTYAQDPQTAASAIAALFALSPADAFARLKKDHDFPEDLMVLSALQHAPQSALDAVKATVNTNSATVDVLKLALVAIGLNRAPEHIFDPRYTNSVIVKDLGTHNDVIVSQYSVWAICENPMLGLKDLGIPLKDIESKPANVRSWMFRLIAANDTDRATGLEYVELGSRDSDVEVRAGLAMGLGDVFFDGIQPLVMDWYGSETDDDVRLRLLDHIVRQADQSPGYKAEALRVYKADGTTTRQRERMEAAAAGQELYTEFRRYAYAGGATLFDALPQHGGVTIMNNSINISGNVTGSAIAQGGDATTTTSASPFSVEVTQAIQSELAKAQHEVQTAAIDQAVKDEILSLIRTATTKPTPETLSPVMTGLKKAAGLVVAGSQAAAGLASVILALQMLGIF